MILGFNNISGSLASRNYIRFCIKSIALVIYKNFEVWFKKNEYILRISNTFWYKI